jgi:DNA replicative helicase MCM subunit Mcm2 (Cdc46/Mcm family)
MPYVALNDTQKLDLSKIWETHTIDIRSTATTTASATHQNTDSVPLDDKCTFFIASITRFFIDALTQTENTTESSDTVAKRRFFAHETLRHFFVNNDRKRKRKRTDGGDLYEINSSTDPPCINPRISQGRHTIRIDHAVLLAELDAYEKSLQSSNESQLDNHDTNAFGAFLYHRPHLGLCVINSAIALVLMTLHRRYMSSSTIRHHQPQHHFGPSPVTIQPQSIIITTRFDNVYPLIDIQDVKTSNAYKFITLRGRIIKVYPKRLRLLSSDVSCLKCGGRFEHLFQDGRYTLPTRCKAADNNCRGQKFELIRQSAKYVDYQMLKLQEEESLSSTTAGRTPRHIELEVTDELVNECVAGDHVKVVGVIKAINSAVKSGRVGKRAIETSTYHLHMVVNSIINTTAELDRNKKDGDASNEFRSGLTFTEYQLGKIIKVAHADHMMGDMRTRMAFPFDLLVTSLCPSIIGHDMVKAGILLSLLGGTPALSGLEDVRSGVSIRSSIHCLVVGDPGT